MWKFNIIKELEEGTKYIENFISKENIPYVFTHPSILQTWLTTYESIRNVEPIFIIGSSSNNNRLYFPLVLWKRNWKNAFQKVLIPIGYSDFDYHDPIFLRPISESEKVDFWKQLLDFIKTNITFDKIEFDGITNALALTTESWKKGEICPNLDISKLPDEEALMKFFKTSLRGDLRRQIRRLTEELGDIALIEYTSFNEIPPETFETFMHHHTQRWPNAYKAPHFHENLLKSGLKTKCVHFSVLMAGNTEVAWHLGFEWNGRYYYYMPAGNQKYLKFSPVKVHLFYLVRRAIDTKLQVFDHLRGEENYKQGWSDGHQYVNTLTLVADNPISKIKNGLVNLKNKI